MIHHLSIHIALCAISSFAVAESLADLDRESLREELADSVSVNDEEKISEILRYYRTEREEWIFDAELAYLREYAKCAESFGKQSEKSILLRFGYVCNYAREVESAPILERIERDDDKVNKYEFPEQIVLGGWPMPGNADQHKGVKGQMLATLLSCGDDDYVLQKAKEADQMEPDCDAKLLVIWAMGYSSTDSSIAFLKRMVASELKRESELARSALNRIARYGFDDADMEGRLKKRAELENYLKAENLDRPVTAGEYYPY